MTTWAQKQDAIAAWVKTRTGIAVVWSDQDYPQPPRPFARLSVIAGPAAATPFDELRSSYDLAAGDITITPTVQSGATYTIEINGVEFTIVSDADATADEIVEALVEAIGDGEEPVTATDNGDGTLDLVHDDDGEAFTLTLTANLAYVNNDAGHEVEQTACGTREFTLSVQVHAEDSAPPGDALTLAEKAFDALGLPSVLDALSIAGVAVNERMPVRRIPDVEGGQIVDRAYFETRMSYAANASERVGYITGVEASSDIEGADASVQLIDQPIGG